MKISNDVEEKVYKKSEKKSSTLSKDNNPTYEEKDQMYFILRSDANWDDGWIIKSKNDKFVIFSKQKMTKKLKITQMPYLTRKYKKNPRKSPSKISLSEAIASQNFQIIKTVLSRMEDCDEPSLIHFNSNQNCFYLIIFIF